MLYGSESISYYSKTNVSIWMLMAFQAGTINIGGYMACHRFVSHVTGFATLFGYELNQYNLVHACGMLIVPIFFLFGVAVSAQLVDVKILEKKRPKYYLSFGFIFLLLLIVFTCGEMQVFGPFGESLDKVRDYSLLILLCFICGLQNGTITSVSKSVIRTTHLTGITTDLGIGLIRILNFSKREEAINNEIKATYMRLGIIFFFCLGSVIGGIGFSKMAYTGFLLPVLTSGILLLTIIYFQLIKIKKN